MKAISIIQPWASLIALGYKKFETRSWKTNYRGELAIHAGKKIDRQTVLMLASEYPEIWHKISPLPTGAIIAVCNIRDCLEIGTDGINTVVFAGDFCTGGDVVNETEQRFGDYTFGRYAWELMDVKPMKEPIPAKGQLGIWNWTRDS